MDVNETLINYKFFILKDSKHQKYITRYEHCYAGHHCIIGQDRIFTFIHLNCL